jgi:glycosyltransferase involved in cell wall biosynthesis
VIVPDYHEERVIAACLDNLMATDDQPDEIIVVDNNSTDRTVEFARRSPVAAIAERR